MVACLSCIRNFEQAYLSPVAQCCVALSRRLGQLANTHERLGHGDFRNFIRSVTQSLQINTERAVRSVCHWRLQVGLAG